MIVNEISEFDDFNKYGFSCPVGAMGRREVVPLEGAEHQFSLEIISRKMENASFRKMEMKPMGGGSFEVGIKVEWGGGNDDTKVSGYAEAEAHDDDGNYVEVHAEQNDDGKGSVSVSAGHEEG